MSDSTAKLAFFEAIMAEMAQLQPDLDPYLYSEKVEFVTEMLLFSHNNDITPQVSRENHECFVKLNPHSKFS